MACMNFDFLHKLTTYFMVYRHDTLHDSHVLAKIILTNVEVLHIENNTIEIVQSMCSSGDSYRSMDSVMLKSDRKLISYKQYLSATSLLF